MSKRKHRALYWLVFMDGFSFSEAATIYDFVSNNERKRLARKGDKHYQETTSAIGGVCSRFWG